MVHFYKAIILLLCMALMVPVQASAAAGDDARQFVDNVGKQVLEVVNSPGDASQQQAQLQRMFSQHVDMAWMGQFVLGRGWQQASEEQRTRYLTAYKNYLLARYTTNFSDYADSKYTITDVKSEAEGQFTVGMKINAPKAENKPEIIAGYRVRKGADGQFKIIDIIIEGVSLITTQRSEFGSVYQKKGTDGLIGMIEEKTKTDSADSK